MTDATKSDCAIRMSRNPYKPAYVGYSNSDVKLPTDRRLGFSQAVGCPYDEFYESYIKYSRIGYYLFKNIPCILNNSMADDAELLISMPIKDSYLYCFHIFKASTLELQTYYVCVSNIEEARVVVPRLVYSLGFSITKDLIGTVGYPHGAFHKCFPVTEQPDEQYTYTVPKHRLFFNEYYLAFRRVTGKERKQVIEYFNL